jgi:hypothetical protein
MTVPGTFQPEDGDKQIAPGKIQTRIVNIDLKAVEVQAFPETLHPAGCSQDMKMVVIRLLISICSTLIDTKTYMLVLSQLHSAE